MLTFEHDISDHGDVQRVPEGDDEGGVRAGHGGDADRVLGLRQAAHP